MKKILFLCLLIVGCDSPQDVNYSSEQLVKYNCKPTGASFYRKETSANGRSLNPAVDIKYYVYSCNDGKQHMSETLIQKD